MSEMLNFMFEATKRRKHKEVVERARQRLAELRATKDYGSNPFVLGETNALLWMLEQMGEREE